MRCLSQMGLGLVGLALVAPPAAFADPPNSSTPDTASPPPRRSLFHRVHLCAKCQRAELQAKGIAVPPALPTMSGGRHGPVEREVRPMRGPRGDVPGSVVDARDDANPGALPRIMARQRPWTLSEGTPGLHAATRAPRTPRPPLSGPAPGTVPGLGLHLRASLGPAPAPPALASSPPLVPQRARLPCLGFGSGLGIVTGSRLDGRGAPPAEPVPSASPAYAGTPNAAMASAPTPPAAVWPSRPGLHPSVLRPTRRLPTPSTAATPASAAVQPSAPAFAHESPGPTRRLRAPRRPRPRYGPRPRPSGSRVPGLRGESIPLDGLCLSPCRSTALCPGFHPGVPGLRGDSLPLDGPPIPTLPRHGPGPGLHPGVPGVRGDSVPVDGPCPGPDPSTALGPGLHPGASLGRAGSSGSRVVSALGSGTKLGPTLGFDSGLRARRWWSPRWLRPSPSRRPLPRGSGGRGFSSDSPLRPPPQADPDTLGTGTGDVDREHRYLGACV